MDKIGIGILRELLTDESTLTLQADVRRPYRDIARKLRVTEDTVRNRVHGMQKEGLIRGWRLGFNPTLLGSQAEYIWLDVNQPSTKDEVIRLAVTFPQVVGVQSFVDGTIGITSAYVRRGEFDRMITRLRRKANSRNPFTIKLPFLSCRLKLTDTDWNIVKAIQTDPRKSFGKVAEELGISRRTVERRAARMINGHAFWLLPELSLKNLDGILAHLSVIYPPGSKSDIDRWIFQKYGASMVMGHSTPPTYSWFAFVVPNFGVANEIQDWAGGLKGVTSARISVAEEIIYPPVELTGDDQRNKPVILNKDRTVRGS